MSATASPMFNGAPMRPAGPAPKQSSQGQGNYHEVQVTPRGATVHFHRGMRHRQVVSPNAPINLPMQPA